MGANVMHMTAVPMPFQLPDPRRLFAKLMGLWRPTAAVTTEAVANAIAATFESMADITPSLEGWANQATAGADILLKADMDIDEHRSIVLDTISRCDKAISTNLFFEVEEAHPLAQVGRSIIQPYNDAVRRAKRATLLLAATGRAVLARAEAEDAEDCAAFAAVENEPTEDWEDVKARVFPT